MNNKRTTNPKRWPSSIVLVTTYCRAVIDWAAKLGTPTSDRLMMAADEKLRKAANLTAPGAGLAEAMGASRTGPSAQSPVVPAQAMDVLARRTDELRKLGEDIDPRAVGVGLDAADKVIAALGHDGPGSPSTALIGSGFFTDGITGREHDHYGPPTGWTTPDPDPVTGKVSASEPVACQPCCADLPEHRPTEWRLHDKRYGSDAPMTTDELDTLRADYAAEQAEA